MKISQLIQGFSSYLEGLNETSNLDYNINPSRISVFMYSSEFKEYLTNELNISDASIFSKSINDILKMDVVNGQLVDKEDENSGTFESSTVENTDAEAIEDSNIKLEESQTSDIVLPETSEGATQPQIETENSNTLIEMLNYLFQDNDVISTFDANGNGNLDEEEIAGFLNSINGTDGDLEKISLDDILAGIEQVKQSNETIEQNPIEETELEDNTEIEVSEASEIPEGLSTEVSTGGSNSSYPSSSSSYSSGSTQTRNLTNMTRDELNEELTTAQTQVTEKESNLAALLDGSDENLQKMNEDMENLYGTYLDELETVDKDMAEQVNNLKNDINTKENEVDTKDKEISTQEGVVTDSKTAYENAIANKEQLQSSLSSLESADTSDMDSTEKADISAKISELKSKITEAEQAEQKAKESLENAENKLEELKQNRDTLQGELDALNQQMSELETQISEQYPQVQESLNEYNKAKQSRDTYKTKAVSSAKSELQSAQSYVGDINSAINKLDNRDVKKEYSLNKYDEEEGQRLVDTAKQMLAEYGESHGWCATGVSRTINMAYGIKMGGNGCDWDTNMEKLVEKGMFAEVTEEYPSAGDLSSLPAGAVVCWEATTGKGNGGAKYGHVTIADGNGGEISDHYQSSIYKSVGGRSDTYRIFISV